MDEVRFKIVKAMLDKFPKLRERVKKYLLKGESEKIEENYAAEDGSG